MGIFKKRWILIIGVMLVTIVGGWRMMSGSSVKYEMGKVTKQSLMETVTESGMVTTSGRANVYSTTTGVVTKVYVNNGEQVDEGQKLFAVKSTATATEKAVAWAAYQNAISNVQMAQNNRRLTQATVDKVHDDLKNNDTDENFTEKETRTTAEVSHDNAYDTLLAAQAALTSAQAAYLATQNSTVTSPISGKVSNLAVATGSAVMVNLVAAPTSPVLVISGLGTTEVAIALGESDINKIAAGQTAEVTFDAIPEKVFSAHVSRFDDQGTLVVGVVKFAVYLTIDQPTKEIKPGMTADVDIHTREVPEALVVPNAAVKPYQKGRAVRVLKGGQLEYIPVEVGIRGKETTQITSGLTEGQEIVISLPSETKKKNSLFGF